MEFQCGICGQLNVLVWERYSSVSKLKSGILRELSTGSTLAEDGSGFYLLHNGRLLYEDNHVASLGYEDGGAVISIVPRVLGGKGGFGSMLRAIGAQIEKTTNRDACRDLSGRRLRDINEEQRLKKWYAKQRERELARKEAKKLKLRKLKQFADGPALPKIEDQEYLQKREDIEESVYQAVDQGFGTAEVASDTFEFDESNSNPAPEAAPAERKTTDNETAGPSAAAGSFTISLIASSSSSDSISNGIPAESTTSSTKVVVEKDSNVKSIFRFDAELDSDSSSSDEDEAPPAKMAKTVD